MIIDEKNLFRALELAFVAAGEEVSRLSDLVQQPSRVFTFSNRQRGYSFFAADLIFRRNGGVVLQEANGSNGASTGMLFDGQSRRAKHMSEAALAHEQKAPWVALLVYANKTGLKPEFHARAMLFARELRLAGIGNVGERFAGEPLADDEVTVVVGPMSAIVDELAVRDEILLYQDRRVGFATNANLLPALQRIGSIRRTESKFNLDTSIFHEGRRGVEVALDKREQQSAAKGSGLTALRHAECSTWTRVVTEVRTWHEQEIIPVAKISNGSQGVGISFFPPNEAALIEDHVWRMREEALAAYGPNSDVTALPVQLFEFAASTPYEMKDGEHLWDMRVECHVWPGTTVLIPDSMRVCPGPFRLSQFTREAVLSNLSGRGSGLTFVRTPFALHESGKTELRWAGIDDEIFSAAMLSLARWADFALLPNNGGKR